MPHPYVPLTQKDTASILVTIGANSIDELFSDIPSQMLNPTLHLPTPASEAEIMRELSELSAQNVTCLSFLGAGAYRHFIPALVDDLIRRGEYLTAYTPYQPEVSQGTLQTAFEFQSIICELTGMEVANAGMYDGASALAEACLMACSVTNRTTIVLSDRIHPHAIETVRTYAEARELKVIVSSSFELNEGVACLAVQQPNFFGYLEDLADLGEKAHKAGALFIVSADPVSLGLFKPPSEFDADIVVGDGQPLVPLSFGGPYVGFFACKDKFVRQMPGRIVGRTTDIDGQAGYVLTLQTREQHIRRERATSNICTSTQLVALIFTMNVVTLGKQGVADMAKACYHKAHFAAEQLASLPGFKVEPGEFFQEFVLHCPIEPKLVIKRMLELDIIAGYDVSDRYEKGLLVCFNELHTRNDITKLISALKGLSDETAN